MAPNPEKTLHFPFGFEFEKSETRNPKQTKNSNIQNGSNPSEGFCRRFDHLNLGHSILPFDMAQGGELVEPFRISSFGFIYCSFLLSL
jgi:hypothetical protein